MFSWLKAKPAESTKNWEILKNDYGEFFVKRIYAGNSIFRDYANLHFSRLKFGNEIQAEQAIYKWEMEQELKKQTHVKYL